MMKISKVDHKTVSVSKKIQKKGIKKKKNKKKEENIIKGQLYSYPNHNMGEEETEEAVSQAARRIKRSGLYSIFSPCPEEADNREVLAYDKIKANAEAIAELLMNTYNRDKAEERLLAKVGALKNYHFSSENCVPEDSVNEFVNFCVDYCLKKSLRKVIYEKEKKYYLPDLIKKLLMITCVSDTGYSEKINAYPNDELLLVIKYLDEDVNKKEQSAKIADSIDNQNVKVQVFDSKNGDSESRKVLKLSGAEKEKHTPLFKFMVAYSAADIQKRNLLLAELRGYITLFITGESKYSDEEASIMSYENQKDGLRVPRIQYIAKLPENSAVFSKEAAKKLSDIYQFEAEIEETKNKINKISDKDAKKKAKKEINDKKRKISLLHNEYERTIKDQLCSNFRKAKSEVDDDGKYWVTYINDEAKKILCGKNINAKRIGQTYLITSIWRNMVAYIGTKYIDMGKAVYHFAMPENMMDLEDNNVFGEVREEYQSGITSFDYEMIKASEMIERDVSVYLTFAINNFTRNTVIPEYREQEGNEDILTKKKEKIPEEVFYKDLKRRYLQFFGGQSKWGELFGGKAVKDIDFFGIMKELLYNLRNENFHYTGRRGEKTFDNIEIIQRMFEYEIRKSGSSIRKKYYSNNVLMFYAESDVTSLMNSLYDKPKYIPAQIPSFANILSRINVEQFLDGYIVKSGIDNLTHEEMLKYHNSIYFVLKEIYYYGFLQQNDLAERFKTAMKAYRTNHDEKWNGQAYGHFMRRVDEILQNKAISTVFYELCQRLITDFDQQNRNYKVRTSRTSEKDIYQHYKMLLYLGIRNAFKEYLKGVDIYNFLKEPVYDEKRFQPVDEKEFCNGWTGCHLYDKLPDMKEDSYLLSWYVAAHFIDARQVNHLMGTFKKHISFTEDIIRRRESLTGEKIDTDALDRKNQQYGKIVSMLEFVQSQTNVFTQTTEDYFENGNENEYVNILANYVDFGGSGTLYDFCQKTVSKGSPTGTVGLFYDQENLILNRNVIMASLYGNHNILAPNIEKITYQEICDYYAQMDALNQVFERNYCETEDEVFKIREYQNEKNRVELTDILIYSEIVNECLAKLISWTYLRERDLMYFQLGMLYVKLYHTSSVAEEEKWMRTLDDGNIVIQDGAVLYEIVAMNDYDMPFFKIKNKNKGTVEKATSIEIGVKVPIFAGIYGENTYAEGLEFFEKYHKDHDDVVYFRNYIDHFKYFATTERSILDLYSDAYDRLFDYSPNFRKSIIYVLENILLRYFAIGHIRVTKDENAYCYKGNITRKAAKLEWKPFKNGLLISDKMTFWYKEKEKGKDKKVDINVPARSELFMKQLAAILQYHK